MRMRLAVCAIALAFGLSNPAAAAQGILLLADAGKPEWNSQVIQLGAAVGNQKPTEVVFWTAANPNVQAGVDRLIQRGVSEIVAVPLFMAAPPSSLGSQVSSSVPVRVAAAMTALDPLVSEILLGRAQEISTNPAGEVLVFVSHRPMAGSDKRWVPDVGVASQLVNRRRQFKAIISSQFAADGADPTAGAQLRLLVERHLAAALRIIVVPVVTPYGNTEAAIREQLQGLSYEMARSGVMPDERLVAWILSRADTPR